MSEAEFPAELVERCALQGYRVDNGLNAGPGTQGNFERIAIAVLRESGHNELVEVLKRLDDWWTEDCPGGPDGESAKRLFVETTLSIWRDMRSALRKAGAP
jgi:hypothetical protein